MMETREDGKKQKAYVAITSSTSYFHSLSSCKGGGGGREKKSKRGRKGEDLAWGGDKKEDSSKTRLSVPLEFTCNGVNLNNILASSHLNYT